jgi:SAM-dependent methyltransferase
MPSIETNEQLWGANGAWVDQGDDWSEQWGTPADQWEHVLLPRVGPFLDEMATVLEIAPGHGRWTQFLLPRCKRLIAVDLNENCIEHCRRRFNSPRLEAHVNDGRSLEMVTDGSVDFVFSFDSLVHVEADVLDAYVQQIARKLRPDGFAFIHHSNLRSYLGALRLSTMIRALTRGRYRLTHEANMRGRSVDADTMLASCRSAGLSCVTQELVPWESVPFFLIDCFTTISKRPAELVRVPNWSFMKEAARIRALSRVRSLADGRGADVRENPSGRATA